VRLTHQVEVILTSSRDPSTRVRSFLNGLEFMIPSSLKINRGRRSISGVIEASNILGARLLLVVSSRKGNPSKLVVYDLTLHSPLYEFKIDGVTLLADFPSKYQMRVGSACLGNLDPNCSLVNRMLIDLGVVKRRNCVYSVTTSTKENGCEVRFIGRDGQLVLGMRLVK